ncbi:hypothetical protein [Desulfopila sp. IMCC35008]|uniref:hypothetical protein n=1 Tax=Desulfopila sp. IMCC35008 TaxID=2653858 RepID=UPI0013D73E55|nr:hypothetical protein [Desulfopila sp. IMCC35008]
MEKYSLYISIPLLIVAVILVIFLNIKWYLRIKKKIGRMIPFPMENEGFNAYYEMAEFGKENRFWQILMTISGFGAIILLGIYH